MARSAAQQWVADYMKGAASSDFEANSGLMSEAWAAYYRAHPGARRSRTNPAPRSSSTRALAVQDNPAGLMAHPVALAVGLGVAGYVAGLPMIRGPVDQLLATVRGMMTPPTIRPL